MSVLVYGLIDPRTRIVRYVGRSSSGLKRPRQHRDLSRSCNAHLAAWIAQLGRDGLTYEIAVLEESSASTVSEAERWWIAFGRGAGWKLTNITDGGEGSIGLVPSDAARKKIGDANRNPSDQTRAKMAAAARGRVMSPSTREKLRILSTGRRHTEEAKQKNRGDNNPAKKPATRAKIRDAARNRSPEWRAAISAANARRVMSDETRRKIGAATATRTHSPEVRARIAASVKRTKAGNRQG